MGKKREFQNLLEVWQITERRNGETYKTRYVRDEWVNIEARPSRPDNDPDLFYSPKGNHFTGRTLRTVEVD